jgi:hypothetical protein
MHMNTPTKYMSAEEAAAILSNTLEEVAERRTSLKRAIVISRLALALTKAIEVTDLRARIDLLEQMLKKRK